MSKPDATNATKFPKSDSAHRCNHRFDGRYPQCRRWKGHKGKHVYAVEWEDNRRRGRLREAALKLADAVLSYNCAPYKVRWAEVEQLARQVKELSK